MYLKGTDKGIPRANLSTLFRLFPIASPSFQRIRVQAMPNNDELVSRNFRLEIEENDTGTDNLNTKSICDHPGGDQCLISSPSFPMPVFTGDALENQTIPSIPEFPNWEIFPIRTPNPMVLPQTESLLMKYVRYVLFSPFIPFSWYISPSS